MVLLPVVRDRAHYSELFKENHHWLPAIQSIEISEYFNIVESMGCFEFWNSPICSSKFGFELGPVRCVNKRNLEARVADF